MNCLEVRHSLSLYLYGELDFNTEELFEQHLHACPECRDALAEERQWHQALGSEPVPVPLDLLSQCREELHDAVGVVRESATPLWIRCLDSLGIRSNSWTMRLATASLLVCLGFGISHLVERHRLLSPNVAAGMTADMELFNPLRDHVRVIEPAGDDRVHLVVDEVHERVISGSLADRRIRELLVAASKDPTDPAIRVDSVSVLKSAPGEDVRSALLDTVEHDSNAGVRLKALEALSSFSNDANTRRVLISVLSHDQNPEVRTQAINLLAPQGTGELSPQLADTLEQLMRSDPDEYIRMRCQQALHSPHASAQVY
jgi:hypothetical protein